MIPLIILLRTALVHNQYFVFRQIANQNVLHDLCRKQQKEHFFYHFVLSIYLQFYTALPIASFCSQRFVILYSSICIHYSIIHIILFHPFIYVTPLFLFPPIPLSSFIYQSLLLFLLSVCGHATFLHFPLFYPPVISLPLSSFYIFVLPSYLPHFFFYLPPYILSLQYNIYHAQISAIYLTSLPLSGHLPYMCSPCTTYMYVYWR